MRVLNDSLERDPNWSLAVRLCVRGLGLDVKHVLRCTLATCIRAPDTH